ncbi:hypothetical protein [Hyphomonas sp.]|uniref:hypothetical protein n=1 Tax=Hyphomonas sp. TaxID=87 RepID=UPI001BD0434B|nr:hypothetical protein [Hyphomonas sp.]
MNCLIRKPGLRLASARLLPLGSSSFYQASRDQLDPAEGSIAGGIQHLSARVKLKLKRKIFTSSDAVNQLARKSSIILFSQHYAAKHRETAC